MNRANFLKSIFGAAVVAAMPQIVVGQIEKPDDIPPSDYKPLDPQWFGSSDSLLFIYDDKKLLGFCSDFSLELKRQVNKIDLFEPTKKVWTGRRKKPTKKHPKGKKIYEYVLDDWPTYQAGESSWEITAANIQWSVDPRLIYNDNIKLNCLINHDSMQITGTMFMKTYQLHIPMEDKISASGIFEGSGELTMILEDGNKST